LSYDSLAIWLVLRTRTIWSVVVLLIIVGSTLVVADIYNPFREKPSACSYLASNYDASVGLISETPSRTRYFLYSDNFLATIVLPGDCNNASLAESVNKTLSRYSVSEYPNQFMAFDCRQYFQGSHDYDIEDSIWSTINNQTGPPLNASYADVALLQAYYDAKCSGSTSGALAVFNATAKMYNGIGFNDTAFRVGSSKGVYQTYKLALFIYTARLLDQAVPPSVAANLERMQARSGGFYTGYATNLSNDGTSTNTETTSLAILALGEK
jgi:hypothetical protein